MSQQPDSSPRITRRLETQPVEPAMSQLDGKAGHADRDDLAAPAGLMALAVKLRFEASVASRSGQFYALNALAAQAAALAENLASWRPPAEQVETPEGLACLRTGTVIRSRHGDIGSIDHGGVGEWAGMRTVVHLLDFACGARLTVGNLADGEMAGSFPWTILHTPTEIGDTE